MQTMTIFLTYRVPGPWEERWNVNRIDRLKQELPSPLDRKILDFGCGVGGFLKRAQGHFGSVVGFDLSDRMVKFHRSEGVECFEHLNDVPQDIDTIVLFHVLEHVIEPWKLVQDLITKFPRVNSIVIEVPNNREALLSVVKNKAYSLNHHSSDHLYYFNMKTLSRILEKIGLKVILRTQTQRYTLGNTLGWLLKNKGGGQNTYTLFNGHGFQHQYEKVLANLKIADSLFFVCKPDN